MHLVHRTCLGRALLAASLLTALPLAAASCVGSTRVDSSEDPGTGSDDEALTANDAISRAEEWVAVKLHYCQSPNHQHDDDSACSSICERHSNPKWDPYRSDCSGLVSWAWGLPAPGRTTYGFAPFVDDITHSIQATDLRAGDAINNSEHVMLFKSWVSKGHRAVFLEEPGCSSATPYAHEVTSDVSTSGSSIHVAYNGMTFTAIRYGGFSSPPPPEPAMHADRIGVSTYGPGRLDLFARDEHDHLQHKYWSNDAWSDWRDLGGDLASAPAAVSWAPGRIDVFAEGKSGHLIHSWWDGSEWHAFQDLGGSLTSAPTVASQGERSLDVFARGDGNHLVHLWFRPDNGWSDWQDLGGSLATTPAAVSWGPGRLDVFARDMSDNVAHIYFEETPHTWSSWGALHGPISGGPMVTSWGEGRLDLFATDTHGTLIHRWYDDHEWYDWQSLGGTLESPPTGVAWGPGRIDVFARGGGDILVHKYFDSNGWSDWGHRGDMPR